MAILTRSEHGYLLYYDSVTGRTVDVITAGPKILNFFNGVNEMYTDSAVNSSTSVIAPVSGVRLCTITTGAANDDDHDFTSLLIFDPSKGLTAEARYNLADVDQSAHNFGFSDAITEAADTIACTFATASLTSHATDCALFFTDKDATTNSLRAAAVNSGTDGTVITAQATAPVDDETHDYRVEIDPAGNCKFYVDFVHVGTQALGVATTSTLCAYFALITRETAANAALLYYMHAWQWAA
ncbi:MAG: hypothetical protein HQ581_27660 [Planctomycetes bacterium]|nr:hypothetical protein [Planctomycetota bacterium]